MHLLFKKKKLWTRLNKTRSFPGNANNDINSVNEQNTHTHTSKKITVDRVSMNENV